VLWILLVPSLLVVFDAGRALALVRDVALPFGLTCVASLWLFGALITNRRPAARPRAPRRRERGPLRSIIDNLPVALSAEGKRSTLRRGQPRVRGASIAVPARDRGRRVTHQRRRRHGRANRQNE